MLTSSKYITFIERAFVTETQYGKHNAGFEYANYELLDSLFKSCDQQHIRSFVIESLYIQNLGIHLKSVKPYFYIHAS